jgi:hypothetical protein
MTPRPNSPQFLMIPLMIALVCGAALLVLFLAIQPIVSTVIGVILVGVVLAARQIGLDVPGMVRRGIGAALRRETVRLEPVSKWVVAVEMAAIAGMVLLSTYRFYTAGSDIQLSGGEAEWITSSAYGASMGLREYGRIPLWQPYLEYGEPLVDNPVSFVLNPISSVPSLILGAAEGLKISVVLTAWAAGLGGWMLGRVLGFAALGRVLLALLFVGKGNMSAMFNTGYFQLAASQAYFPWIIAGVLGTIRLPDKRWPPVMFAASFALLLFAGNVWYTLPMAICAVVVAGVYVIRFTPPPTSTQGTSVPVRVARPVNGEGGQESSGRGNWIIRWVDWPAVRRLVLAGALALGVSAALFIPLWMHQSRIGNHPAEVEAGWIVPLWRSAAAFYFNPDPKQLIFRVFNPMSGVENSYYMDRLEEFYYSFVVPSWFVALIFVGLPFYRPRWTRLWLAAWGLIAFFTLWGAGGQPLFLWLYANIPFLQGWRYVGRALAVGAFWIAVLVAMRVDSLWKVFNPYPPNPVSPYTEKRGVETLVQPAYANENRTRYIVSLRRGMGYIGMVGLTAASLYAAWEVNWGWNNEVNNILNPINANNPCISWLREQHPDEPLTVWQFGYIGTTTYLNNHVRIFDILADFEMTPMEATLGNIDLTESLPEYGVGWVFGDRGFLKDQGYLPLADSPRLPDEDLPCLYRKANALSYAYTVSLTTLAAVQPQGQPDYDQPPPPLETLPPETTTPVTDFIRQPDTISLGVKGDPTGQTVLTVQERAFPGWGVTIDGVPARLESVGGQVGVILPSDDRPHVVTFSYRPPLFILGAVITLLTSAFCILYLLRADRFFRRIGQ